VSHPAPVLIHLGMDDLVDPALASAVVSCAGPGWELHRAPLEEAAWLARASGAPSGPEGLQLKARLEDLTGLPGLRWAELEEPVPATALESPPDGLLGPVEGLLSHALDLEDGPEVAEQRQRIDAWDLEETGRGVRVAHLDTGLARGLSAALFPGLLEDLAMDFSHLGRPDGVPGAWDDLRWKPHLNSRDHGTRTASLLAAQSHLYRDSRGLTVPFGGIAPGVELLALRVADSVVQLHPARMARAIHHAARMGAQVCVICMGSAQESPSLQEAIAKAREVGMLIVAAAGNHHRGLPFERVVWPARHEDVLAIGAMTWSGGPYVPRPGSGLGANHGPEVDLCALAPDTWWLEALIEGGEATSARLARGQGTSNATPQVAAAAALWLERHGPALDQMNIRPGPDRLRLLREALLSTAMPGEADLSHWFGAGLIQVGAALRRGPQQLQV
jgi:subtilisin family serine protease